MQTYHIHEITEVYNRNSNPELLQNLNTFLAEVLKKAEGLG